MSITGPLSVLKVGEVTVVVFGSVPAVCTEPAGSVASVTLALAGPRGRALAVQTPFAIVVTVRATLSESVTTTLTPTRPGSAPFCAPLASMSSNTTPVSVPRS